MPEDKNMEILIDTNSVNIPVERYEELIRKETALSLLENAYHSFKSYNYDNAMLLVFGSRGDSDDAE